MTEAGKQLSRKTWGGKSRSRAAFDEWEADIAAIEAEAVAAERARYTPEAFALALTHIRGAHNADSEDERLSGVPCDWCRLAGEQAAAAVLRIIEGGSE